MAALLDACRQQWRLLVEGPEFRTMFTGLDSSGKTTILYMLKLGEVVPVIPTMGFNVEKLRRGGRTVIAWDVGGMRQLVRHYFDGLQAIMFVVDCGDHARIGEAAKELNSYLEEDVLRSLPLLVFANKQDLPGAMSAHEVDAHLGLALRHARSGNERRYHVQPCSATTGHGLWEGIDWLLAGGPSDLPVGSQHLWLPTLPTASATSQVPEWLTALPDIDTDDDFLAALEDCSLLRWDHYAYLRVAWLFLTRFGRRDGQRRMADAIRTFIATSPVAAHGDGQTTFHETMTYFWMHMTHYAIVLSESQGSAAPPVDAPADSAFRAFLRAHPYLGDADLFLRYYSKQLMLLDPASRRAVALPDIRPLPSLVPTTSASPAHAASSTAVATAAAAAAAAACRVSQVDMTSDDAFLAACADGQVQCWGHSCLLRLLYCVLQRDGGGTGRRRSSARRAAAGALRGVMRSAFCAHTMECWLVEVADAMGLALETAGSEAAAGAAEEAASRGLPRPGMSGDSAADLAGLTAHASFAHAPAALSAACSSGLAGGGTLPMPASTAQLIPFAAALQSRAFVGRRLRQLAAQPGLHVLPVPPLAPVSPAQVHALALPRPPPPQAVAAVLPPPLLQLQAPTTPDFAVGSGSTTGGVRTGDTDAAITGVAVGAAGATIAPVEAALGGTEVGSDVGSAAPGSRLEGRVHAAEPKSLHSGGGEAGRVELRQSWRAVVQASEPGWLVLEQDTLH